MLQSYLASLCTISRLYGDPDLLGVVMGDKADDVEPGTDLAELVASEDYETLVGWRDGWLVVGCGQQHRLARWQHPAARGSLLACLQIHFPVTSGA